MATTTPTCEIELIYSSVGYVEDLDFRGILKKIELCGRTCYKSEDKITENSYVEFIKKIIKSGHLSVIEHGNVTVKFIVDRGVSHELVRHRLASYSQESTRYCKYDDKIKFIIPSECEEIVPGTYSYENVNGGEFFYIGDEDLLNVSQENLIFIKSLIDSAESYQSLLKLNWSPQRARAVLPNALKTEICMTANLREWKNIFEQRTSMRAHPDMRYIMTRLFGMMKRDFYPIFEDLN